MSVFPLTLPSGAEVPPAYRKATPEEAFEMLSLGALVYEVVQTQRSEEDARERAAAYAKELQRIQASKDADVAALKSRYERETATMRAALEEKAAADCAVLRLQQETTLHQTRSELRAAEGRLAELQARKAAADADVAAQLRHAVGSEHAASERLLAAKDAELRRVLAEKEAAEADRRAIQALLKDKFHALTEEIRRKPASSKEKGALFEAAIDELVRLSWGAVEGFSIADYSARGHRGDRIVTLNDQTILLECKDYCDVVPKSEVDKFFKDVATNHAIQIGILISRTTGIQGFSSRSSIDFLIQEGKLHIFVNEFDRLEEKTTMSVLLGWIRYWKQIQKPATEGEDKAAALRTIKELVDRATVAKRELAVHAAHLDDVKSWTKRTIDDMFKQLQQALLTLQRGPEIEAFSAVRMPTENTVSSGTATAATGSPGSPFKPEMEDTEWAMRVREVTREGPSVELAEIAKVLSAKLKVSVPLVRGHLGTLFQDSFLQKVPGLPTVVRGLRLSA
jgi:hypothetical protein